MKTSDVSSEAVTHESGGARTLRTSELLRKAADEIRRRGWYQGDYGDELDEPETCKVCSLGALNAAITGIPNDYYEDNQTRDLAVDLLARTVDTNYIHWWNDDPERTVEEVLDAFNRAATLAEQDERAAVAAEGEGD